MGRLVVRTTAVVLMAGCLFGCSKSGLSRDQLELRYVEGSALSAAQQARIGELTTLCTGA